MNFRFLAPAMVLLGAVPGLALARNEPSPPPSGIVVHLFGPNSLASQILPNDLAGPRLSPAGSALGSVAPSGAMRGTAAGQASGTADAGYQEPSMHQILHEMFVTGDPNQKPGSRLATGRRNDHP